MSKFFSNLLFLVGLVVLAAVGWWTFTKEEPAQAESGRPPFVIAVTLGAVERGELEPQALLTGTVASTQRARVGFESAGRIERIAADEGDAVAAGTVLASLDPRDAAVELMRAQANEELAARELEQVLAGSRSEEKRRLQAELEARIAESELARKDVERGQILVQSNIIAQNDYDAFISRRDAAAARVEAAREALAEAEAGARPEEIAVQRAEVELRKADVAAALRAVQKTELRAPFAASVVRRTAAIGDSVTVGQPVFELVDLSRREIELEVPGTLAAKLGERPQVELTLEEYSGFSLTTELDAVVAAADEQSRTFRGVVRLEPGEDPEQRLKPGMFARARVELEPLRDVLIVPSDAVRVVASGTVVVRAKPGDAPPSEHLPPTMSAEWIPVRVLATAAGRSAIEPLGAELAAGDSVVLIGVDLAFPGAPLLPRTPHTAPAERQR